MVAAVDVGASELKAVDGGALEVAALDVAASEVKAVVVAVFEEATVDVAALGGAKGAIE